MSTSSPGRSSKKLHPARTSTTSPRGSLTSSDVEESNKDKEKEKRYEISPCFSAASDSQSTGGACNSACTKGIIDEMGKTRMGGDTVKTDAGDYSSRRRVY